MQDPIRDGVNEAVNVAQHAGIQVKMITGDYRKTAEKIARTIGLMKPEEHSLEGEELAAMSDQQLQQEVKQVAVFSRIRPQDKLRIVRALQSNGDVTAMIGDGVNDAPALQRANIGVVVGTASDVAKETADLILLDSNFRTIVAAIEEGRVIFENIRKVVAYTLSNSFAEVSDHLHRYDAALACPTGGGTDPVDPPDLRWSLRHRTGFRARRRGHHGRKA